MRSRTEIKHVRLTASILVFALILVNFVGCGDNSEEIATDTTETTVQEKQNEDFGGMSLEEIKIDSEISGESLAIKRDDEFYPLLKSKTMTYEVLDQYGVTSNVYMIKSKKEIPKVEKGDELVAVNNISEGEELGMVLNNPENALSCEFDYYADGNHIDFEYYEKHTGRVYLRSIDGKGMDELIDNGALEKYNAHLSGDRSLESITSIFKDPQIAPIYGEHAFSGNDNIAFLYLTNGKDVEITYKDGIDSVNTDTVTGDGSKWTVYNLGNYEQKTVQMDYEETDMDYYIIKTENMNPGLYAHGEYLFEIE